MKIRFDVLHARLFASLHEAFGNHRQAWLWRHHADRLERRAAGVLP